METERKKLLNKSLKNYTNESELTIDYIKALVSITNRSDSYIINNINDLLAAIEYGKKAMQSCNDYQPFLSLGTF